MAKLTLNVDSMTVVRAKRYATRHGTSISRLVEQFLAIVSGGAMEEPGQDPAPLPPVLARLRRELGGATVDERSYRNYLDRKYR